MKQINKTKHHSKNLLVFAFVLGIFTLSAFSCGSSKSNDEKNDMTDSIQKAMDAIGKMNLDSMSKASQQLSDTTHTK